MAPKHDDKRDKYWRVWQFDDKTLSELRDFVEKSKNKYPVTRGMPKARLLGYAKRIACYQLCYHNCSGSELRKFVRDRGVKVPDEQFRRKTLIDALEKADSAQTFARFTDLPPELRVIVYELYTAEFPEQLHCPAQPPLTRVCRLLRSETLPLFYDRTTLKIKLDISVGSRCLKFNAEVMSFVLGLSEDSWSMVRKLHFEIPMRYDHRGIGGLIAVTLKYESDLTKWLVESSIEYAQTMAVRLAKCNDINSRVYSAIGLRGLKLSGNRVYGVRRAIEQSFFA
ncbi:hypothetical protein LTR17_004594 [Elasticomyces elasticus]|nr:hypothetical protein LTR17_004594 [Elasticomyces elasticus]